MGWRRDVDGGGGFPVLFLMIAAIVAAPVWTAVATGETRSLAVADETGVEAERETPEQEFRGDSFQVTNRMRRWLRRAIDPTAGDLDRLRQLDQSLNDPGGLHLREIDDWSGDGPEVFDRREADCVGYAFLFSALAEEAGLEIAFAIESKADRLEVRSDVQILRRHLAVLHPETATVWDFSGARRFDPVRHQRVARETGLAILESNRGMQSLLAGDPLAAVESLRRAARWDPSLGFVWSNLAVAIRRSEAQLTEVGSPDTAATVASSITR